ncbi:MAG: MFS transporter, partial [Methylococcaceae bacterium]
SNVMNHLYFSTGLHFIRHSYMVAAQTSTLALKVYSKLNCRLLPFLVCLYIIAYIDRVNIGFAKLTMSVQLGFSDSVYGLGAGIFFIGYFLFEIPSNLILQRVGAKIWIARIMIIWGLLSGAMVFVSTPLQFYILRFLLGVGEAGFFPGIILYLTYWYPAPRRAKATATFMTALALAGIIGGPLSGFIMAYLDGVATLRGWQWLFLVEAAPAVILGVVVALWLENSPEEARWLADEERLWLVAQLHAEAEQKEQSGHVFGFGKAICNIKVWLLSLVYFSIVMGLYGISFWLPQIVKESGQQNLWHTGLLSALPYVSAAVGMMLIGHSSDQRNERGWHIALSALAGSAGLILSATYNDTLPLALLGLSLAILGILSALPVFWSLPTAFLSGRAAAGGLAFINAFGNLAGYLSPVLVAWIKAETGSFTSALYMLAAWLIVAAAIVLIQFRVN